MNSRIGFICFCCLVVLTALSGGEILGQGEVQDESTIIFRNERSIGVSLNSSGYGASYRYGRFVSVDKKMLIQGGIDYIKDPKEIKSVSYLNQSKSFVYGKINSLYNFHVEYGIQKELFGKFDKEGLAIRYFITVGPAVAMLKPKMYEVIYPDGEESIEGFETFLEKNMINSHGGGGTIIGNASFLEGIENSTFVPGVHLTLGASFDYSTSDELYNAFEAGIMLDGYIDNVPIMYSASDKSKQFFLTFFLTYRIGRILDAY